MTDERREQLRPAKIDDEPLVAPEGIPSRPPQHRGHTAAASGEDAGMSDMAKSMPEAARTRSIAVDEYYRMADVGILRPDERVELLNGRIIEMPPIGPEHALVVELLHDAFRTVLRNRAATFA